MNVGTIFVGLALVTVSSFVYHFFRQSQNNNNEGNPTVKSESVESPPVKPKVDEAGIPLDKKSNLKRRYVKIEYEDTQIQTSEIGPENRPKNQADIPFVLPPLN